MAEALGPDAVNDYRITTLLGDIGIGDIVAIGVRDGNSGGIRVGTVLAIKRVLDRDGKPEFAWNPKTRAYDIPVHSVQVKVTISSEYRNNLADAKPRWYGTDSMVRVG